MSQAWNVAYFPLTDQTLEQFIRKLPHGMDCVVNALQLLDLVDNKLAAFLRIITRQRGIYSDEIEGIFRVNYPDKEWRFQGYPLQNIHDWEYLYFLVNNIPPKHVVFAGVKWPEERYHVIIIGRSQDGRIVLIDPQVEDHPIMVGPEAIQAYYSFASKYYFLENKGEEEMEWESHL